MSIKEVDLQELKEYAVNPQGRKRIIDALTSSGGLIINKEDSGDNLKEFEEIGLEFFSLPMEEKQKLIDPTGKALNGYIYYPGGADGYFADDCEIWHADFFKRAHEQTIASFQRADNLWPDLPRFQLLNEQLFNSNYEIVVVPVVYGDSTVALLLDDLHLLFVDYCVHGK